MHVETAVDLKCYHCGQPCEEDTLFLDDKAFCCYGCKTVFEILNSNNLCEYYTLDKAPGVQQKSLDTETFAYLDEQEIQKKLLTFNSDSFAKINLYIPAIHCVSCIWLLENLQKIDEGILRSEVNFAQKSVTIDYNPEKVKLGRIAVLLRSVGYSPLINLEDRIEKTKPTDKSLVLKLALAGFCFGNIMLFSFPEYLGLDASDESLRRAFSWLNLALSIPVFFYSGIDYLKAAAASFKQKQINIDVPIAAGLIALFLRSAYDIVTATGPGYLDSFSGLVFFLLIGRWFQSKTYESLAFDRDFKSYFPLAVQKMIGQEWKPVIIYELRKGDQIKIRNMEIIPADSILMDDRAYVDYSFVTGESRPQKVQRGELVYAGGRLIGQPVALIVEKQTSQSHLTSLWNHEAFRKREESNYQKIIDRAARRFTWIVLGIAIATAVYWYFKSPSDMWLVLTSVLMVACPCALALAAPFTYGSMLRVFGKHGLYLKNANVIERMASINSIVFDKTGTVTYTKEPKVLFAGALTPEETSWVKALTSYSTHPLSMLITKSLHGRMDAWFEEFKEIPGKGIEARINGHDIRIGSAAWIGITQKINIEASHVFIEIDREVKGHFSIAISVRSEFKHMIRRLGRRCAALLSGDHDTDRAQMSALFRPDTQLLFNQSPHDKLAYISELQSHGRTVMMLGDGLNDAGALKQSDVGLAVTDDTGVFTPACDGILAGDQLNKLDQFLSLASLSSTILKAGFALSFFYNAIALSFAVTGHLTPLVAAILMPISSVSVVSFSSLAVRIAAKNKLKQ